MLQNMSVTNYPLNLIPEPLWNEYLVTDTETETTRQVPCLVPERPMSWEVLTGWEATSWKLLISSGAVRPSGTFLPRWK